jgi:plastocyanin
VSRKLIRLMFVATVVTGISAPMLGAEAAPRQSGVDAYNMPKGFFALGAEPANRIEINVGDTVAWTIREGEHTITPRDGKQWGDDGSGTIDGGAPQYVADNFKSPGEYFYFCEIHGSREDIEKPNTMWGVIHVNGPTTTTTTQPPTPTTQATMPPTTTTTRPGATPPASTATAPTTRPTPTTAAPAPAPTTTTAKPDKKKDGKEDETTTTSSTLPPPVDLPNEAIVPTLPGSGAAPGSDAEPPIDTPEGEAVALLKPKKDTGGDAVKLLIVSGLGLGALGVGTAGYKYANRSSKYFPA